MATETRTGEEIEDAIDALIESKGYGFTFQKRVVVLGSETYDVLLEWLHKFYGQTENPSPPTPSKLVFMGEEVYRDHATPVRLNVYFDVV